MKLKEKKDIADTVKEGVLKTQECQLNYYGSEDKEFSEDY